tara:strand:- start:252 stop:728 length:477 start_codon:yes stop_codon:yes gene_type:complete
MMILGIDPGPTHCGFVVYDSTARRVIESHKQIEVVEAITGIDIYSGRVDLVAIERVQSYGIAGSSLLRTSETVGMLYQCSQALRLPTVLLYRREILRGLDALGKGNKDSLVRQRLIEMHGGERRAAQGTKKAPGPLYGVASHAWAALAVAVAAQEPVR